MHLHAYLIPTGQLDDLTTWAHGKDWFGRWMPDIVEPHNVLLGSHPHDPGWEAADGAIDWWPSATRGPLPGDLRQCALQYSGTGTRRDASAGDETTGFVPTQPLIDALHLPKGHDFQWNDLAGLAVCDPSVTLGGPGALVMRRDLAARLQGEGMAIFWTVLASRELHLLDHSHPGDDYRWVTASATYILTDDKIRRIYSTARRCRPGPVTEYDIKWTLRPSG